MIQTARTAAPATRCDDVARVGRFRHFAGSMSFVTTPPRGVGLNGFAVEGVVVQDCVLGIWSVPGQRSWRLNPNGERP